MTREEYEAVRTHLLKHIHSSQKQETMERVKSPYARKMLLVFQRSVVVILILALSFNLSKPVAAKSLPGDLLYPIKIIHEEIEIAQIRNPKEKAKHQIERTKKRIAEIETLKKKHQLDKEKEKVVAEKIKEHVEKVNEVIEEMKKEEPSNALELNTELVSTLKASVEVLKDDENTSGVKEGDGEEEKDGEEDNTREITDENSNPSKDEGGEKGDVIQETKENAPQDIEESEEKEVKDTTGTQEEEQANSNTNEEAQAELSENEQAEETSDSIADEKMDREETKKEEIIDGSQTTPVEEKAETDTENLSVEKTKENKEENKESENPLLLNILQAEVEKANAVKDDLKEQIVREYNETQAQEVSPQTETIQQNASQGDVQSNKNEQEKIEKTEDVTVGSIEGGIQEEEQAQEENSIQDQTQKEDDIKQPILNEAIPSFQEETQGIKTDNEEELNTIPEENFQEPLEGEALGEVMKKIEGVQKQLDEYHSATGIGEDPLITQKRKQFVQEHRYGELLILLQEELEKFKTLENMEALKEQQKVES